MRIGIFYDKNLPYDGVRPGEAELEELRRIGSIINLANYEEQLKEDYSCLVNLHGRYFIKPAWMKIKEHLFEGRGFVNIGGGTPFSVPVSVRDGEWQSERQQTAYHEEINIRHGMHISKDRYQKLTVNAEIPLLEGYEACFERDHTVGLIVKFTSTSDTPSDAGTGGAMDAVLYPLLTGSTDDGRKTAAPVVMIENTKDVFEGGRWIFANINTGDAFWSNGGVSLINRLAAYCSNKAYEIIIRPNYASYYPGEQPTLLMQWQRFGSEPLNAQVDVKVRKDDNVVFGETFDIKMTEEPVYTSCPLNFNVEKGMYTIEVQVLPENECTRTSINGFWGYDRELMESGENLKCGRDYFYKDGKPMPVVGMTYMQPDVHRKFIYLPNVFLWDRDFAEFNRIGINMIRTGIWTAHRTVMFNDGIASEEILRAIDAMFLTAKKHDIHIVFNFFAFAPEMWEGVNPYLDPRSIKAQKRFISSVVSRHVNSKGASWDLINEPSVCNPKALWSTLPNRDKYELAQWRKWLKERHGSIERLQERWNCSPAELPSFDAVNLPEDKDFQFRYDSPMPMKGLKVLDYFLFAQHVMNKWAEEMMRTIRFLGSEQLVTIGQDEALGVRRPSPLFYQESVDYTTNHSWWLMDDLYWDGIFCKAPNKPNLIQETGIMYVQNADSSPRRTEAELRNILERKYALAFAADNAGAVHWIWNINIYMDNVNESNIGAVRADGTQKMEADVSYDFGDFIKKTYWLFEGRKEAKVAVIYPYSNEFSVRDYAPAATKKLARILGYNMNIPFKAYSEYHLEDMGTEQLIILPSPRTLTQDAWETVICKVKEGSVLLITGPFSSDEYWARVDSRREELGLDTVIMNINREEVLYLDGKTYRASFGNNKIAWIDKEVETAHRKAEVKTISLGKGRIIWCPLPIEMNEDDRVTEAVYTHALNTAGIKPVFEWILGGGRGILVKKLEFEKGNVYCFVSECGEDTEVSVKDKDLGVVYNFVLPSDRSLLFATDEKGSVMAVYGGFEVSCG